MSDTDPLLLAELLCARLCHDLAGPLGAAAAGAELIEEMGADADADTLGLVAASAAGAAARLKFLRAALGPASESAQPAAKIEQLARAYIEAGASSGPFSCTLDWHAAPGDIDGRRARLLLNLVMLAHDSLPRGGRIRVRIDEQAGLSAVGEGEAAALGLEVRDVLLDGHPPSGPRAAQASLTLVLAGRGLVVAAEAGRIGFTCPAGEPPANSILSYE